LLHSRNKADFTYKSSLRGKNLIDIEATTRGSTPRWLQLPAQPILSGRFLLFLQEYKKLGSIRCIFGCEMQQNVAKKDGAEFGRLIAS
jgi:hypothetical protein